MLVKSEHCTHAHVAPLLLLKALGVCYIDEKKEWYTKALTSKRSAEDDEEEEDGSTGPKAAKKQKKDATETPPVVSIK